VNKLPVFTRKADLEIAELKKRIAELEKDKVFLLTQRFMGNTIVSTDQGLSDAIKAHNLEQQAKGIIFIRQKTYNKDAELLIDHGLNGSDCKRISAWLDYELQQLHEQAKGGDI
jgi:hypothetical protein